MFISSFLPTAADVGESLRKYILQLYAKYLSEDGKVSSLIHVKKCQVAATKHVH